MKKVEEKDIIIEKMILDDLYGNENWTKYSLYFDEPLWILKDKGKSLIFKIGFRMNKEKKEVINYIPTNSSIILLVNKTIKKNFTKSNASGIEAYIIKKDKTSKIYNYLKNEVKLNDFNEPLISDELANHLIEKKEVIYTEEKIKELNELVKKLEPNNNKDIFIYTGKPAFIFFWITLPKII